jgi:hypothetical protein
MVWPWQRTASDTKDALLGEVTLAIGQASSRSADKTAASIRPNALLGADLGLSSIAVARLAGILQKRCGRGPLPFHTLFVKPDGMLLQDIRVSEVVTFLERHLCVETP